MAALAAFRDGWTALRTNPALLLGGLFVALVVHVQTVGEGAVSPAVSVLASLGVFLAFPFVAGGFTGMALGAIRGGDAGLGEFARAGRTYYLRVLVAAVLIVAVVIGVMTLSLPITFVPLAIVVFGGLGETAWFGAVGFSFAVTLLTLPAVLLSVFFLQFSLTAVVAEDVGARAALSRSARLVRRNFWSVVGFSLLWGLLSGSALTPESLSEAISLDADLGFHGAWSDELSVVASLVVLLLTTVTSAYFYTVYTAYYVRIAEATPIETERAAAE
ncbi:hypothetical protein [Halosimplex sp. TS25]|uniref:DUF7847 domain-containing protein n=1 Tax=Halosimplex rarum TaxID=3396619 RepID=UPI0039E9BEFA